MIIFVEIVTYEFLTAACQVFSSTVALSRDFHRWDTEHESFKTASQSRAQLLVLVTPALLTTTSFHLFLTTWRQSEKQLVITITNFPRFFLYAQKGERLVVISVYYGQSYYNFDLHIYSLVLVSPPEWNQNECASITGPFLLKSRRETRKVKSAKSESVKSWS